jgi:hypothetical protein
MEQLSGISLSVFDPTGAIETGEPYAPRLDTLSGKTICEINHRGWDSPRIFPYIREQLQKRVPDVNIIPFTEFPNISEIQTDALHKLLKEKGCDGVIVGNAA